MIAFAFRRWTAAALSGVLAGALALAAAPARAAETSTEVLADFQAHGYASPPIALERLRQATPPPEAPLAQRWRHESAVSGLAMYTGDHDLVRASMASLQAMADREGCAPCGVALALRRAQIAEMGDSAALRRSLAELTALPEPADPALRFEWYLARATAGSLLGEHDSAIADALKASEVATAHDRPADLVSALDVLSLINGSRRDLQRALEYARRGATLAREIGFRFGLSRLLVNHSYALATLKGNTERQAVLQELLLLTEATRGLELLRQNTLINLAALSNDLRHHRDAANYAVRAEQATRRDTDPNGYAFAIVNRGVAWVHLGRIDEGLALVKTAVEIGEQTGEKRELADLVEQQVDALEAAGRPQAALQALRRWVALNNELTTSQREQAVTQLQETFAAQQRQREIEKLKLDNELRAWRERAWVVAAALVALLAFITWQRLARSRRINRSLRKDVARLADESQHDALTGACNRRHGDALLQRLEQDNAQRPPAQRRRVALLLLDVDHFKRVNDTHGHAAGDAVLVEMTRRLQAVVRDGDAVVRWGGEEFLLVLPGTDEAGLRVVAQRALAAIGAEPVEVAAGKRLAVRSSAGGVVWRAGDGAPAAALLAQADAALYLAKAEGRNRALLALSDAPLDESALASLHEQAALGRVTLGTVHGAPLDATPRGQEPPVAGVRPEAARPAPAAAEALDR